MFGVTLAPSILPLSIPVSTYTVPLVLSMYPPVVPISVFGTSQTSSVIRSSAPVSKYGILRFGVQHSSIFPPQVGS